MTNINDDDWIEVYSGAVTNTTPNSTVTVELSLDAPSICPNMTDSEFRKLVLSLTDEAVAITKQRVSQLTLWTPEIQMRVATWFGTADPSTRGKLIWGLGALVTVMSNLTARNFVRPGSSRDLATGCMPNTKSLTNVVAHVCGPDVATHTIAIGIDFCTLPDRSASKLSSKQLTIVHECSHFIDTFGTTDVPNGYGRTACEILAKTRPDQAIINADSIAWFVLAKGDMKV